jgi:hypothetical protein
MEADLNPEDAKIFIDMISKDKFYVFNKPYHKPFVLIINDIYDIEYGTKELTIKYKTAAGIKYAVVFKQKIIEHYIKDYRKNYLNKFAIEDKSAVLAEELDKLRERIKQLEDRL